jgi:hypothetical protein
MWPTKETVIIVHGTWAGPNPDRTQWYQPTEDAGAADGFVSKLNAALQERGSSARCWAHCYKYRSIFSSVPGEIFSWSPGENNWIARTQAAFALADYVAKLQKEGWRYHIVAHSHGGNVVVEALPLLIAEPVYRNLLGKIVTLGTPFLDTISPIRRRTVLQEKWLPRIGLTVYFTWFATQIVAVLFALLPPSAAYSLTAALAILAFIIGVRFVRINRAAQRREPTQAPNTLLAISCPTDEAWQILNHLPKIDNPLSIQTNLLWYLVSSWRGHLVRLRQVSRIRGARSYGDIGIEARFVAALLDICVAAVIIVTCFVIAQPDERLNDRVSYLVLGSTLLLVVIAVAVAFTATYGAKFYSAVWSPFRTLAQLLQSFASVGPALGTYLVRRWSWPVLLRMVLGLEGYGFRRPPVRQFPSSVSEPFAKYESMPPGSEQRALEKRSAWITRHLGEVSQTFSNLVVTAADITSLLRKVEADQTLVHAAYYTDDECIARIADWIAGNR